MSNPVSFHDAVLYLFNQKYPVTTLAGMEQGAITKAIKEIAEGLGATNVQVVAVHDSFNLTCDEPKNFTWTPPLPTPTFQSELEGLINKYSIENQSSTPDFLLAEYMLGCLAVFNTITIKRASWYGREAGVPGCLERNKNETAGVQAAAGDQPPRSAAHAVHTLG